MGKYCTFNCEAGEPGKGRLMTSHKKVISWVLWGDKEKQHFFVFTLGKTMDLVSL